MGAVLATDRSPPKTGSADHVSPSPKLGTGLALFAWAGLVVGTHVWGARLARADPRIRLFAAPLAGGIHVRSLDWRLLPALAVAGLAVALGPSVARWLPWRTLLWVSLAAAGAWAVGLAFVGGGHAITAPLTTRWDYLRDLPLVGGPHDFVAHFTGRIASYTTHVRAHPPGMLLVLWSLARLRFGGPGAEAALVIAGGAAAVPAVLVALRDVAGERAARLAAPFVALAPIALWVATSADALFAGVAAWGACLLVLATGRRGPGGDLLAVAGGLLLGAGALLSYGLALIVFVPLAVAISRGRFRPLIIGALGMAAVVGAFAVAGFWWLDGLRASRRVYEAGAARYRPQSYFWLGNLGALALGLGPASAVALARLRGRGPWLLPAGALLALAVADASAMSKGEIERIWLPFAVWLLAACCAMRRDPNERSAAPARAWLALNMASAMILQLVVRSPW